MNGIAIGVKQANGDGTNAGSKQVAEFVFGLLNIQRYQNGTTCIHAFVDFNNTRVKRRSFADV